MEEDHLLLTGDGGMQPGLEHKGLGDSWVELLNIKFQESQVSFIFKTIFGTIKMKPKQTQTISICKLCEFTFLVLVNLNQDKWI